MLQRWNDHIYAAKRAKGGRWHFPNAIRRYGKDAFSHEILEICNSIELANAAEEKWIEFYGTRNSEKGFNLTKGGGHVPHSHINPWDRPEYRAANLAASRARLAAATRISSLNKVQSRPEVRKRLSEIMKRVAATPGGRAQRMKSAHPGKILTAEHRAKISANDATKRPEVLVKISASVKAAWADPEKRAHMSANKKFSPEAVAKAWVANRGRKLSDETKRKISESLLDKPYPTHCRRGHAMKGYNVIIDGRRHRCRSCINLRDRARRMRA